MTLIDRFFEVSSNIKFYVDSVSGVRAVRWRGKLRGARASLVLGAVIVLRLVRLCKCGRCHEREPKQNDPTEHGA